METIGNLIDKLTVTNIRIWMAEDIKRNVIQPKKITLRLKFGGQEIH